LLSAGTEVVVVVVSEKLRSHGCGERRGQQYGRRLAEARKKPLERADLSSLQKARNLALNQLRKTWSRSQKADEDDDEEEEGSGRTRERTDARSHVIDFGCIFRIRSATSIRHSFFFFFFTEEKNYGRDFSQIRDLRSEIVYSSIQFQIEASSNPLLEEEEDEEEEAEGDGSVESSAILALNRHAHTQRHKLSQKQKQKQQVLTFPCVPSLTPSSACQ
jgi:hypothetical protein